MICIYAIGGEDVLFLNFGASFWSADQCLSEEIAKIVLRAKAYF
jgi:hypothetical protein